MVKRIAAVGFILVCTSFAWAILGGTMFYRTYSSDAQLKDRVASSWGAPQEQSPSTATFHTGSNHQFTVIENGQEVLKTVDDRKFHSLTLQKSRVLANLHLDYRRKGLLWFSTYQVLFSGAYEFTNPDDAAHDVTFSINLPAEQAVYDDLTLVLNGTPLEISNVKREACGTRTLQPHETALLDVGYRSQGLESWRYS